MYTTSTAKAVIEAFLTSGTNIDGFSASDLQSPSESTWESVTVFAPYVDGDVVALHCQTIVADIN